MFDFVLDLALDWDNVEDYTKYVVDESEVLEQKHQVIGELPVEVVVSSSPSVDDTVDRKNTIHDYKMPVWRGLRISWNDAKEINEEKENWKTQDMARDTGRWIVDNWWIVEKTAESYDPRQHY